MTQDYQSIGKASSELEAVAQQHQGWGSTVSQPSVGDHPESMGAEITDRADYSFRDRRANMQIQTYTSTAAYTEPPMAAIQYSPMEHER